MNLIEQQHKFFNTGVTRNVTYRIRQLRSLYQVILLYQERISQALYEDLHKSEHEAYLSEIGLVLSEISYTLRHIRKWSHPRWGGFSIASPFSVNTVLREPYGVALILSPFNYPFQLALTPLVSALAAGNCVVLKPSELTPATTSVISEMLNNNFEQRLCAVVTGGPNEAESLVRSHFDYIFFTGGSAKGKLVYQNAAENLVPVTLELGGKSPCIVDKTADIDEAARRITWGKYLNAGQTCVAPDYLLVHSSVKKQLLDKIKVYISRFYGEYPEKNPNYTRIVNNQHFERLCELLTEGTIAVGGATDPDTLKIAPTVIENAPFYSKLMNEEIFGPILPVIEFDSIDQVEMFISRHDKPLALYLFSKDRIVQHRIFHNVSFGGGCINDVVMHLTPHGLPFGGIGPSGIGKYHGKAGFDTFTHEKSVLYKMPYFDLTLRYPPYGKAKPILKRIYK